MAFLVLNKNCMKTIGTLTPTLVVLFVWLSEKLRAAMDKHVPVGYQDETGFHYGSRRR